MSFREQNIPEISVLNVLPQFRRHGIASKLLNLAEIEASRKTPVVGIGVGLYADYGAAQQLYVKRGYISDGLGLTSHYKPALPGESVRVDDDLVLWLTKKLV